MPAVGLGFGLSEEGTPRFHFIHDGGNEGFRCIFVMYPELGRGAVVMTNSHVGDGLWNEIRPRHLGRVRPYAPTTPSSTRWLPSAFSRLRWRR